jgi:hypothetical protein
MPGLRDYLPDADSLISLSAEDLGMLLLELMQAEKKPRFTPSDFEMPLWNANVPEYPHQKRQEVGRGFGEAWLWLQNEGLVMPDLDQPNGWFCLTRKGAGLRTGADVQAYQHGKILPEGVLHSTLVAKVRPMFLRGDYDVAVVQAARDGAERGDGAARRAGRTEVDASCVSSRDWKNDGQARSRG